MWRVCQCLWPHERVAVPPSEQCLLPSQQEWNMALQVDLRHLSTLVSPVSA